MVLNTIFVWVYLQLHFMGIPESWKLWKRQNQQARGRRPSAVAQKAMDDGIAAAIEDKYKALGEIRFHEIGVLVLFLIMVLLWVFKNPQVIEGWDVFFPKTARGKSFVKEATPTLLVATVMFFIPSKAQYYRDFFKGG